MKKIRWNTLFLALCLFCFFFVSETGIEAAQPDSNQFRFYLKQGIEKAFNLEADSANVALKKAVELDRENPVGYAFLAMAHLLSYETSFELKERERNQEIMLRYAGEALVQGEKRIEKNTKDGQAYFAMALAKIVKVRWAITQKRYFMIGQEASDAWYYLEQAKEADPQNFDLYFPMGLLHYHLDHLPDLSRFVSSVLITPADSRKGLQELELAAQKGYLLKELAKAELSAVYTNFENKPAKALAIARELKEKFPRNYNSLFGLANALSSLHRFEEAFATAREIEKGIRAGVPPFGPHLKPRYYQLMGRIFLNQGQYAKAIEYFQKVLNDASPYNARVRAQALVHLGMIHDAQNERDQAEECYSKALKVEGGEGLAQAEARKYLKTPYAPPPKP